MYLVEIIPIARGITTDTLSYFSLEMPPVGSIVQVPVRNKQIPGIVAAIHDARTEKTAIKQARFELKKVDSFNAKEIIPHAFITSAEKLAYFYASTIGSVLWSVLPNIILQHSDDLPAMPSVELEERPVVKKLVRANGEERMATYRSAIRECFARKKSAYVCAPTIEDAEQLYDELSRGISNRAYILHSELPKKKTVETWLAIAESAQPLVVIGTPSYLCIPRQDIGLVVIERESSRGYRMQSRPYIDTRRLADTYATHIHADMIRGDVVVSTESWQHYHESDMPGVEYHEERPEQLPHLSLISMGDYKLEEGKPFRTISDELYGLVEQTLRDKKRLFIFTPRKGLYPTTMCADCGKVVTCERCSAPVVVHKQEDGTRIFLCHHCGKERPTEERCINCNSWRLATLGIGIERVVEDIQAAFPHAPIFTLDKNTEPTRARARKKVAAFLDTPGGILIGTEYALLYLPHIDHAAVASLDSLLLMPDFRMHERILGILSTVQYKTRDHFLIQTRVPHNPIFGYLSKKTLRDFYASETEERRVLGLPPFAFYIKLSRTGKQENVERDVAALVEKLSDYDTTSYPGRIERIRNAFIMHVLIKLPADEWVEEKLHRLLTTLPPVWSIRIDPDSLL